MGISPYPPEVRCIMCDAPMLRFEYAEHLRDCVIINTRIAGRDELDARIARHDEIVNAAREQAPPPPRGRRFGL